MIPLKSLIDEIKNAYPDLVIRYIHPSIYLIWTDESLSTLDEEGRRTSFFSKLRSNRNDAEKALEASGALMVLCTPDEYSTDFNFIDTSTTGHHWIEFLAGTNTGFLPAISNLRCPVIHFYGFKGGQARSTVLSMLGKALADDGYSVLAVDADIEAPSLASVFDTKISTPQASVLGVVHFGMEAEPQSAYVSKHGQGHLDLLGCRPNDPMFDLDLAIFALNCSLNSTPLVERFRTFLKSDTPYDVVLIDHRSGIASTVIPLASAFPGPIVSCVRLDDQSTDAESFFRVLFLRNVESPGLFISFSLDPETSDDEMFQRNGERIDQLLGSLADAIREGAISTRTQADDSDLPDAEDLRSYWLWWFHDRALLSGSHPSVDMLLTANRKTLVNLRELLRLPTTPSRESSQLVNNIVELTNSGNTDQGILVATDALRKLTSANSPFTYVFGRKGTGKTRLVRALIDQGRAEAILVADDFEGDQRIKSTTPIFRDLVSLISQDQTEKIWWILLDCALQGDSPIRNLDSWVSILRSTGAASVSIADISSRCEISSNRREFVIDGVETAFDSSRIKSFVDGLFRFLSSVQGNSQLNRNVTIRLFLRTDLAGSIENVEQQTDGRALYLTWNTQAIFNFALTRIQSLQWFNDHFPGTVSNIKEKLPALREGSLSELECNSFLKEIFPEKLRRNNLLTLTFLKNYFAEGEGEQASYYPRIYDYFLRTIASPEMIGASAKMLPQLEENKVAQPLILQAHEYASKEYLKQVVFELRNLVRLPDTTDGSGGDLARLIEAFRGLPTPFRLEDTLETIYPIVNDASPTQTDKNDVRQAIEQMRNIGIFEPRPLHPGWLRAGRLFKGALGMKYVRR
jgi:hypothetical protein